SRSCRRRPVRQTPRRRHESAGTSGGLAEPEALEVRGDGRDRLTDRFELPLAERPYEQLLDVLQVRPGAVLESRLARFREDDLGSPAVVGAGLTADEAAPLHAAEVMRQPAALPADARCEFRRPETGGLGLAQRQQDLVVRERQFR